MTPWTPDQKQILIEHWKEKSSVELSLLLDKTRSSVCGMAKRMKLKKREKPKPKIETPPDEYVRKKVAPITPIIGAVSLFDIKDGQCRYVTDQGANMMLCGANTHNETYCREHCELVYVNYGKKRDVNVKPMGGY